MRRVSDIIDRDRRRATHARNSAQAGNHRFSSDPPQAAGQPAGQPRLPVQPDLPALPRQRRAHPHRDDEPRDDLRRDRVPESVARQDPRSHWRRAGAECALPGAGARRAQSRRARDGPLQPDDPGAAGTGRPRAVPRRERGGDRRLAAVLPRRERGCPARQGRVRGEHPRAEDAECARLRASGLGARTEPGLQPARGQPPAGAGQARARLPPPAAGAIRRRLQPSSTCSPTCRSSASAAC